MILHKKNDYSNFQFKVTAHMTQSLREMALQKMEDFCRRPPTIETQISNEYESIKLTSFFMKTSTAYDSQY